MIAHNSTSIEDCILRGASAMTTNLSKLGTISSKKHGEPLDDSLCVYGFEKVLSAGQFIDFGDPVRPVMDCIEQLCTRQLVRSRMGSLFFITKFLRALVTDQENPAGAELSCYPDELSKADALLACFESHKESLLDWVR